MTTTPPEAADPTRPALPASSPGRPLRGARHPAWRVAGVAFLTIVAAAAFGSAPGLLVEPLSADLGWSRAAVGLGVSVQLALYGLTVPFAAALMDRWGIRPVLTVALGLVVVGALATVGMTQEWQLVLGWGVLVGLGTGCMAPAFAATVTARWFTAHRGLVSGVLTAASASGQLVFLPLLSWLIATHGWRSASVAVALAAVAAVPLVLLWMRDRPADLGVPPFGSTVVVPAPAPARGAARRAVVALARAARTPTFWLLCGAFAICGATTNGLVKTHFVPAAHDHGMAMTVGASLLALVGVFDIVGTVASGWLTDRVSPRVLLGVYYTGRGVALIFLPALLAPTVELPMVFFIVFYGLDWVATVPPTMALCREHHGDDAPVVFGWVLASHQVGAGLVAWAGGLVRDHTGSYDLVWYVAGLLCAFAALMSLIVRRIDAAA
ncbi:MFS transporter [Puerhibacterium puerhi]|uniref:MFS transporter n=1 Tax=Puerhibacterium puerhi TaxID=2692623 RepID=UPI00135C5A41|nr:MFS transporter [Puerhibacterium puerhi]